jgi:hypothetical protein
VPIDYGGFGLGCDGVVRVLVEPIGSDHGDNPLIFIAACFDHQQMIDIDTPEDYQWLLRNKCANDCDIASP